LLARFLGTPRRAKRSEKFLFGMFIPLLIIFGTFVTRHG
jgi:hypothetical protein